MDRWVRSRFQPNLPLGKDGKRVTACKEHVELSLKAAEEGMVLLKNEGDVLPLQRGSRVALFGKGTFDYVKGGGGSGDVTTLYIHNIYDGLSSLEGAVEIFPDTVKYYKDYVDAQYKDGCVPGMMAEAEVPTDLLKKAAAYADTAIISISRFSGEGWDRTPKNDKKKHAGVDQSMIDKGKKLFPGSDFYLTDGEAALVDAVKTRFPKVIAVLNVGGMVDTDWFAEDDLVDAVLMAWQGGMEGGLAAARILTGLANPSGKLTDTFAKRLEDYPSTANFHDSDDYVEYKEDIYVGYRYFETIPGAAEKVNYPFGFGLSYTGFVIFSPSAGETDGTIFVTAEVTNIGDRPGKEVLQLYYGAPQGKLGKPAKSLIRFEKTRELQPGETQLITFSFSANEMASYDDLGKVKKSAYVLEKGTYRFYLGTSVRDVEELSFVYELKKDKVVRQLSAKLVPNALPERLLADGTYEKLPVAKKIPDYKANKLVPIDVWKNTFEADAFGHKGRLLWGEKYTEKKLSEVADGTVTMDAFIKQLSDHDLMRLLGGQPNLGVANTFGFGNLPDFGVPSIMTADGPAGLRINPECMVKTTAFPCATLLASTFNTALVEQVGEAAGKEVKENNIAVWLTPAINIHRSVLCGRNFEYYSEDPYVAGKMGAAMIRGIQSNHVAASVKHFALNNKETNRMESDSRASERAIREIYLKAFEIVVKEADPWTIMSSYNVINACRASENKELLTDILRDEWGFNGLVTSDWWNHAEHYKEVLAGNDIKMAHGFVDRLTEAQKKKLITRKDLEICARRVLELILKID
ncbi:MAG: glycoside hydrolase family 3 C-terminal domain-containing protein [Lachnospiraceae bacterium]|nr:glycoside hydrolase family 3 C-terminal domain-containing protein [Lachnospiraceae bacterium]